MAVVIGLLMSACGSSSAPAKATYTLGHFPDVPTASFSQSASGALQAVLDGAVKGGLPGVTATVLTADGKAWTGAAGTADEVHPVEASSQFGIASITKTVIAAEVMRLSEKGLLRLNDPVSAHLPSNFHFDTNGATIENLLHMESGIPDPALSFTPEVVADPLREWKVPEILATVPAYREKPGEHFVYGDSNYMLLVLVIEATTGTSVANALRSDVLADPRFTSMVYQPAERPMGPLALPFVDGKLRPNIIEAGGGYLPTKAEASEASGSGCMASDSGALALWGYLLFGGKLLSEKSLLAMTDFGTGVYGLGVYNQTLHGAWRGGGQSIGNGGWDGGGYSSVLAVLPSEGIVISVMTNTAGDPKVYVFPVAQDLFHVFGSSA
ncbi:MAG: beta-lactamase family protein [Chloroflexi bacterium]|nr:MAG: beta-lactamase family protein [Chloroflexota bacterium]